MSTNTPEYQRVWRAANPDKVNAYKPANRRAHLRRMYNITPEQYNAMLLAQGGHCALCSTTPIQNGGVLAVDHDHDTGVVRGLLCDTCNARLPTNERLVAILAYLGWL